MATENRYPGPDSDASSAGEKRETDPLSSSASISISSRRVCKAARLLIAVDSSWRFAASSELSPSRAATWWMVPKRSDKSLNSSRCSSEKSPAPKLE